MAIARNVNLGSIAKTTRAVGITEELGVSRPPAPPPAPPAPPPPAPPAPPPPAPPQQAGISAETAAISFTPPPTTSTRIDRRIFDDFDPRVLPPILIRQPDIPVRTTTQVAQGALTLLRNSVPAVVAEAVTTAVNKRVNAKDMMRYLERKVIIGEVLNVPAAQWSADTRQDFADAFQMVNTKTDVMNAIVAISLLNDPDLLDELRDENVSDASGADLLENRRVVAQYPPPGTPLEAPYLVLVAVEYRDTRRADEIIQSIVGDLVDHQGYKLPRTVVQSISRT